MPKPLVAISEKQLPQFRGRLLAWFRREKRDLEWRRTRDPYRIWISEIMLQQTRVAAVTPYYLRFLDRFPTVSDLARAREDAVLHAWAGLGYYSRARNLRRAAQEIVARHAGQFPDEMEAALALPGIGHYTASAVLSIAYGKPYAVLDGNVARVLARLGAIRGDLRRPQIWRRLQETAGNLLACKEAGDWNQAMMELGATVCLPRAPLCPKCPVRTLCRTRGEHSTPKRAPQRSLPIAFLLDLRKRGTVTEVLLELRATDASLMPAMYELPPLPPEAVADREPVLRVRHSITNTNYYVQVFAPGRLESNGAATRSRPESQVLRRAIPKGSGSLHWTKVSRLAGLPLTGLTRKILQRLHVMENPHLSVLE